MLPQASPTKWQQKTSAGWAIREITEKLSTIKSKMGRKHFVLRWGSQATLGRHYADSTIKAGIQYRSNALHKKKQAKEGARKNDGHPFMAILTM
ncbi:MAG: hypothetical protein V9E91_01335 [Burkholderiaceae bacterium]